MFLAMESIYHTHMHCIQTLKEAMSVYVRVGDDTVSFASSCSSRTWSMYMRPASEAATV